MTEKELVGRLSQLRDMRREVDELSQRIAQIELAARGRICAPGPAQARALAGLEDARSRMEARRLSCMEELGCLYAFIDDLPDSRLRRIFAFRYIDGLTWLQVAFRIGETDEQYPRRVHNKAVRELAEELTGDLAEELTGDLAGRTFLSKKKSPPRTPPKEISQNK